MSGEIYVFLQPDKKIYLRTGPLYDGGTLIKTYSAEGKNLDDYLDHLILLYMARHGIENVRGGKYLDKDLSQRQIYQIQKEIKNDPDIGYCWRCDRPYDHRARDCEEALDYSDSSSGSDVDFGERRREKLRAERTEKFGKRKKK